MFCVIGPSVALKNRIETTHDVFELKSQRSYLGKSVIVLPLIAQRIYGF